MVVHIVDGSIFSEIQGYSLTISCRVYFLYCFLYIVYIIIFLNICICEKINSYVASFVTIEAQYSPLEHEQSLIDLHEQSSFSWM